MNEYGSALVREIEEALAWLAERRGDALADQLRSILYSNLDRGRVQNFIEGESGGVQDYLSLVTDYYERLNPYLRELQVEKSEERWKELIEKLTLWAYNYFLGINFTPGEHTMEMAEERAAEAAMRLLEAYFPYDTSFGAWARTLLVITCRNFVRTSLKKSAIPSQKLISLEDATELFNAHISNNPIAARDRRIDLMKAISQLPALRRRVVMMLYFDGMKSEEIAARLHKNVGAVYSLHFYALQDLKRILSETGNNDE